MIIGNNGNFNNDNNNFANKFRTIRDEGMKNKMNPYAQHDKYLDINDRNIVDNRAFDILQQRYRSGAISLEEFNKKCQQLNKMRRK